MVNKDLKPHLWIPTEEVQDIENKPTGRSEDRGVDHVEHGSKLSAGLQNIISAYAKLETGDSLSDEDIRVFKLILPDGEKIANRLKFIQAEGMTINIVKDDRHAIVSTKKSIFDRLAQRVNGYKEKGQIKDYQYIDGFEALLGKDKQANSLKEYLDKVGKENITVDVQMLLMPKLSTDVQRKVEKKITEKIKKLNGELPCDPYKLSDGTSVIRAKIPVRSVDEISNDTAICRMEQTRFFQHLQTSTLIPLVEPPRLDNRIDVSSLPVVAVLDNGVDFPEELESLIVAHWTATGCAGGDSSHGTPVSSKVIFAHFGNQLLQDTLIPRARVIDCNIMEDAPIAENVMIARIEEAVNNFKDIAKIYNLSANTTVPIEGDTISIIGYALDALTVKNAIKFVISAGNHEIYYSCTTLEEILDDTDTRIAAPADSMLNITVGAITGIDHKGSQSSANMITPYSRKGPGFAGLRKPDIVAYGATCLPDGSVPRDPYSIMLGAGGKVIQAAGTSFTAPLVAGDLAELTKVVPSEDVLLAEALLYHGAQQLWITDDMDKDDASFLGDCYGRGLSSVENSKHSSPYKVTFLRSGELNRKTKQRVKFFMPTVLAKTKGRNKARVIVTCVTLPPVDNTKGTEYLGAYISASLHKIGKNGRTDKSCNPSVTDGRKKWDTCYHFEQHFTQLNPGDWEVWLELFTRWEIDGEQNIPYALAVTIEDMTQSNDIYNEILIETQGRFPAVNTIRIPVRS